MWHIALFAALQHSWSLLGVERTTIGGGFHLRLRRSDLLKIPRLEQSQKTRWGKQWGKQFAPSRIISRLSYTLNGWGDYLVKFRFAILAGVCLLAGCASQPSTSSMSYARVDGRPTGEAQARAALPQCQGEGARSVDDQVYAGGLIPWVGAVASRSSKENTITNACMARNGYLAQ